MAKAWLRFLDRLGTSGLNTDDREAKRALDEWLDDVLDADGLLVADQDMQEIRRRLGKA